MAQPDTTASAGTDNKDHCRYLNSRCLMFPWLVRREPSSFRLRAQLRSDFGLSGKGVCRVTGPADNMEGQEREGLETEET